VELLVLLAETPVGLIRAAPDGQNEFTFLPEYLALPRRPVLGQYFEDHLDETQRSRISLPPFFSNLLPEGGLRELVARRAGVASDREPVLLALLGEDLPGAVVVRVHRDDVTDVTEDLVASESIDTNDGPLRFSLAGAQLKFSVLYRGGGRGPTLAVDGRGGNWIAKLPSETYEEVPENEYAMINWARRVGIDVPETALVKAGNIEGLPVRLAPDRIVFLSRRFDRPPGGKRVHQEDFAQVLNVRHSKRYGGLSYTSIARIVRAVAGDAYFDEVVRRTAFNVLIGNGDAHLKNWSLSYPDGIGATLSPAYDLVATTTYIPDDKLALRLSRENRFDAIGLAHFERLAEKVAVPKDRVIRIVRDTIQNAMAAWPDELSERRGALLRAHVERLRLLKEVG
jgi:serine/threonine-protein kinase HipA